MQLGGSADRFRFYYLNATMVSVFSDSIFDRMKAIKMRGFDEMNEMDKLFLKMIHDPALRKDLLVRLEKLGLLSAFLEIENGTIE